MSLQLGGQNETGIKPWLGILPSQLTIVDRSTHRQTDWWTKRRRYWMIWANPQGKQEMPKSLKYYMIFNQYIDSKKYNTNLSDAIKRWNYFYCLYVDICQMKAKTVLWNLISQNFCNFCQNIFVSSTRLKLVEFKEVSYDVISGRFLE